MKIGIGIGILLNGCLLYGSAGAQKPVPSDRERHHKVVFENSVIRILEGRVGPHDTTPEHTHSANAVVVFLSGSTFGIQGAGQQPILTAVKPGDLRYVDYGDKPVSHIVWDQSGSAFHFLVVELKKKPADVDSCPVPATAGLRWQWHQPLVTAYDWRGSGGPLRVASGRCAWLLIDITRDGRFYFFPPQTDVAAPADDRYILLRL